ncbi:hypothetical protein EJ06DRAFT_527804 [Trichodelitschia bisporula]|uniref:SWR1-complex protein 3 domain-containing protein n=1 Tax=Trichodelitschia bisporula TaxID=703511 RepID=A0A6G1I4C0_9PEZI|nr:hypothetical protein EJ06DRAFT_527804 [Trichodelitschia bisporula]
MSPKRRSSARVSGRSSISSTAKRRRSSAITVAIPSPSPAPPTPVPEPTPPISLPVRIHDNQPLPTLKAPQAADLPDAEYQSIKESGVLAASLSRSRHAWTHEGIFEKYWSKSTYRKKKEQADADKAAKPDKAPPMSKVGRAALTIEPHTFEIMLFMVKDPAPPPVSAQNTADRPFLQYGPQGQQQLPPTPPVTPAPQQQSQQAPYRPPTQYQSPVPPPKAPVHVAPVAKPPQLKGYSPPVPPPQYSVPPAPMQASPPQYQPVPAQQQAPPIQHPASPTPHPAPPTQHPAPPTQHPAPPAQNQSPPAQMQAPLTQNQPPPPPQQHPHQHQQPSSTSRPSHPTTQTSRAPQSQPRAPAPSTPAAPPQSAPDPVIQALAQRASTNLQLKGVMKIVASGSATPDQLEYFQRHIDELTKMVKDKQEAERKKAAAHPAAPPQPAHLHMPPPPPPMQQHHAPPKFNPPPKYAPSVPPPKPKQQQQQQQQPYYAPTLPPPRVRAPPPPPPILHVLIQFADNSSERFLFPRMSILEYAPGYTSVVCSFLAIIKGMKSEGGKEVYLPVTMRFAGDVQTLNVLGRVVAPQEEVRRHMEGVMERGQRAEMGFLALRLPREAGE